jgi:tRNA pseudouridine38-40 synthase
MMRLRIDIEYDGTDFCGFQRQKSGISVQQALEEALFSLCGQRVTVHGAGRTDAGVHAMCMTCHFDLDTRIPPERLCYAMNFLLSKDIRVKSSRRAEEGFHARFDAKAKWYRYRIFAHPQGSALYRRTFVHVPYALEPDLMARSLEPLAGTHDFAAFAASGSKVKSTVRTLYGVRLHKDSDRLTLDMIGDGFLYNMVRIIAGTMIDIGRGKIGCDAFAHMIETKDRLFGGQTAPAHGLTLMRVFYSEDGPPQALCDRYFGENTP